ncbi:MAG: hypothetical protein ACRD10_04360 [Terriglobia bacterium]
MYDFLAEIFVYALAIAYLVLFIFLIQYWIRNLMRSSRKRAGDKPAVPAPASRQQT